MGKGVKIDMELQIDKRRYIQGEAGVEEVIEPVATVPYETGIHPTSIGDIALHVGKFNKRKGIEKVVLTSQALSAKRSETRRVVEFPKDIARTVSQDISATDIFVFSRTE